MVDTRGRRSRVDPAVLLAVAVPLVAWTIARAWLEPSFTVDDRIQAMAVQGTGLTDQPEAAAYYCSAYLGQLLAAAARRLPTVPVYFAFQQIAHCIATALLVYGLLEQRVSRAAWLYATLVLLVLLPWELLNHQVLSYTSNSILIGTAMLVLALRALERRAFRRRDWTLLGIAALMAMLQRQTAFLLVAAVASPLLAVALVRFVRSAPRGEVVRTVVVGALFLVALKGAWWGSDHLYRSGEWRDYTEFAPAKAMLLDYHRMATGPALTKALRANGWTKLHAEMVTHWSFADPDVFTTAKLERLIDLDRAYDWRAVLQNGASSVQVPCTLMLAGAVLLWLLRVSPRSAGAAILGMAATALVLIFHYHRFLPRIWIPAAFAASFAGLAQGPASLGGTRWQHVSALVLLALVTAGAALWVPALLAVRDSNRLGRSMAHVFLAQVNEHPERVYVFAGSGPLAALRPEDPGEALRGLKLLSHGTYLRTPVAQRRIRAWGSPNIYHLIAVRKDVRVHPFAIRNLIARYVHQALPVEVEAADPAWDADDTL